MSKNNNGGKFNNKAAKRFRNLNKIDLYDEAEIYDILNGDISIILEQLAAFRSHDPGAVYPEYLVNAFGNLSTAKFFYEYVDDNVHVKKKSRKIVTTLSEEELDGLRFLLADIYKKSASNFYANQIQEFADRNKYISKAFIKLCPREYNLLKKLDIEDSQRRDLTIQVWGDPTFNVKYIHRKFNDSNLKDSKKIKLLKELYGKRFAALVGAAMTLESTNSDFAAMLYDYMASKKKKKRAKFIHAYANSYKRNKTHYFRINSEFIEENKPIIKELKRFDVGYKKAFKNLKEVSNKKEKKN